MSNKASLTYKAELIADVTGKASDVRGASFANTWTKLYKAGGYYIDLTFTPRAQAADLIGELLTPLGSEAIPQGKVILSHLRDGETLKASLDDSGGFMLKLQKVGQYQLDIQLGSEKLSVQNLEAS